MVNLQEKIHTKDFYSAVKARRSYYSISNESILPDERLEEIINEAVVHCPSPMNSQSSRVALLLGDNHLKLWDLTIETLRNKLSSEKFELTEKKLNSFRNGYGTVLYFEDHDIVKSLQEKFPSYKDNFPLWSEQTSGMLQLTIWTALEHEGYGASLQHYNPLIDDAVKKEWNIPSNFKLIAQMPFGKPTAAPMEKQSQPVEKLVKVFK